MAANGEVLREQCFLSAFIDEFAKRNRGSINDITNGFSRATAEADFLRRITADMESAGNVDVQQFSVAGGTKTFPNFTCVMTSNPGSLVNSLVADSGLQQFFNLSPAQMSAVMPKIRIFKMRYENEDDPGTQHEFTFRGNYRDKDVTQITQDRSGRGAGVGIKSFEWELIGTNTAEVDNNIKANLKIFFQNFRDFVSSRVMSEFDACQRNQNVDDILPEDEANYLDLIFRSSKFTPAGEDNRRTFNSKYYRIKAVLGWSIDPNMARSGLFSETLVEKINNVGTTLLLSLLSHDIDFRQDGTVLLNLEYHAAVESMLTDQSTNLLYADGNSGSGGDLVNENSEVRAVLSRAGLTEDQISRLSSHELLGVLAEEATHLEAELQEEQSEDDEGEEGTDTEPEEDCGTRADRETDNSWALDWSFWSTTVEEQIEADQSAIRTMRNQIMSDIYTRLVKELQNNGMHTVDVPDDILEDENPLPAYYNIADQFSDLDFGTSGGGTGAFAGADVNTWARGVHSDMDSDQAGADTAAGLAGEGLLNNSEMPVAESVSGGERRIIYFYLGDLLNIALKILKKPENPVELGNINLLLGTIFVHLPKFRTADVSGGILGRGGRIEEAEESEDITPTALVHMADIPISLNLFLQFFTDRVIARDRTEWSLRTFLRELFSYLIYPSLGSDCGVSRARSPRPSIDILHISAYGDENDEDRTGGPGRRISDSDIEPIASYNGRLSDRRLYHYVAISANNFNSAGRNAMRPDAPDVDAEAGIYWLNIGNDSGIVKEIKFKKTDQPGLRESRMEREGSMGLGQLRDKYDADITLFGNSLFQPGQQIYINPTVVGLQEPGFATRLSSILGIGGYHQIITVDNAISDNTYETILNTKWVGSGVGGCPDDEEECP